jgi:multimeric flavodoxin WrbA
VAFMDSPGSREDAATAPPDVLGLSGGPRRNGNSERLLAAALAGAEVAGARTEMFRCAALDIEGCRECGGCDNEGRCVVDDGMQPLYDGLLSAGHVILASPIFFLSIPSQGKRLIDRCQALWVRHHRLGISPAREGRRGLFIATAGGDSDHVFDAARETVKAFFAEIGVQYWGELLVRPLERHDDVEAAGGLLSDALKAGERIVEGGPGPAGVVMVDLPRRADGTAIGPSA